MLAFATDVFFLSVDGTLVRSTLASTLGAALFTPPIQRPGPTSGPTIIPSKKQASYYLSLVETFSLSEGSI